jgi:uncharacterized membrane protein
MTEKKGLWQSVLASFSAGLLVLLPLVLSTLVLWWAFNVLTAWTPKSYQTLLNRLVALIALLAFITLIGWFTRLVIGKKVYTVGENLILQVPVVSRVYLFFKEVSHTLFGGKASFDRVVLVEYPRPGVYALAFVTSHAEGEVQAKTRAQVVNVFIPTTPNPTSGFLLMVPRESVIPLEMSVADGMKLVISGGSVVPKYPAKGSDPLT